MGDDNGVDDEGRDVVEMMLVVPGPKPSTGEPRRSPVGRKRRSDARRSVKGLGEIASIAKLRNMFMGNVTAMQSYSSMMAYNPNAEHIKLTPQQMKKVRAAFDLYDEDKSGAISADEMTKARGGAVERAGGFFFSFFWDRPPFPPSLARAESSRRARGVVASRGGRPPSHRVGAPRAVAVPRVARPQADPRGDRGTF